MSSFCSQCKKEIVWGTSEVSHLPVALDAHPERRIIFSSPLFNYIREVDTWMPHRCPAALVKQWESEGLKWGND